MCNHNLKPKLGQWLKNKGDEGCWCSSVGKLCPLFSLKRHSKHHWSPVMWPQSRNSPSVTPKDTFALVWVVIKTAHSVASSWDFYNPILRSVTTFKNNELCRHLHCQHAGKDLGKLWRDSLLIQNTFNETESTKVTAPSSLFRLPSLSPPQLLLISKDMLIFPSVKVKEAMPGLHYSSNIAEPIKATTPMLQ